MFQLFISADCQANVNWHQLKKCYKTILSLLCTVFTFYSKSNFYCFYSISSNIHCEYLTVWPQQGQHACNNEAAEHQVVKKGRGASYESPPPPAIPPRHPRNNPVPPPPPPGFEPRPSGNNPANSTTIPPINNATANIKEDKSSTNQANGRSKGAPTLHRQAKSF